MLIGHVNIYHLQNKVHDLANFLHRQSEPFLLYGIAETRLHAQIDDDLVNISDYSINRRDARRSGETGLAAYIHHSIEPCTKRRKDLEPDGVECIWLEYRPKPHSPSSLICFLYRNGASSAEWYDDFSDMLDCIYKINPNRDILLLGDFNIDLIKPHPRWSSVLTSLGLAQLINKPTRVASTSATLLDHIYCTSSQTIADIGLSDFNISDHSGIWCKKQITTPKYRKDTHIYTTFRTFKHFNKDSFLTDLSFAPLPNVYNYSDPNLALNCWYSIFLPILNKHAPFIHRRVKHAKFPQWITHEIRQAMDDRDDLKAASKQSPEYKRAKNKIKNMIRDSKRKHFNSMIENNSDTAQIWRALNAFTKGRNCSSATIPADLTPDLFNNHFLSIAESLKSTNNTDVDQYTCPQELKQFCDERISRETVFKLPPITVFEVMKYITQLPNKKSSGADEISNYILKLSLPYIIDTLTYIFNLCLTKNTFPADFKKAKVIPLPKSKLSSDPSNYRPISLLSVLSKVLEKHVHFHLHTYLETHSLLHPHQSGFRRLHSCSTALSLLNDNWLTSINNSEISGSVFLDFSKAFDLISHKILIHKLSLYLNNSESLGFFESFLSERTQRVFVHGKYSQEGHVQHGVPQGSVLGPLLFCLFINDLPLYVSSPTTDTHMLADDTTLHTSGKTLHVVESNLQDSLNGVQQWCSINEMMLNPTKTKSIVHAPRQKHQRAPLLLNLKINNENIECVSEHKLLGIIVDNELRWQPHVDYLCKRVSKNLLLLSKLRNVINKPARILFYNAHIQSHLHYASVVWDNVSDVQFKRLNSLHRRAAKLIHPDPSLSTDDKLLACGLLSLKDSLLLSKGVFVHKILHLNSPGYLTKLLRPSLARYSSHTLNLLLPKPRLDLFKSSLAFSGPSVWNSLPLFIKSIFKTSSFKCQLKRYLLNQAKDKG